MSLHFVLGASGSGKSRGMYRWIIKHALANPNMQYMIVVPDQYTMQIQKQMVLLHPRHAILNIDVLSFSRLYHRVMEELGGDDLTPLDDTGKNLILRKLASSMKEDMTVLGNLLDRHGYISEVKGIISELQQYGISPEGMKEMISGSNGRRGLQARLEDIQKLYYAYLEFQQGSYRTSESMYPILTKRLKESKMFQNTIILMDSFTGFTPVQMPLVQEMMVLAKEMYVTMTIDEDPSFIKTEQELFFTTAKTILDLEKLAEQAHVLVAPYLWCRNQGRFLQEPALAHFEQNLFRSKISIYEADTKAIQIWEARNPQRESLWVASEVKRLIREENYQYRDIAIICGSMDAYRYHLEEAFLQMDIPYFIDASTKILHNPAMELLLGLLEMLEKDFSYAGVMRYLRSGFSSILPEEADLFEIYLIETGLRGRKAFERPFTRKGKTFSLEKINDLRERLLSEIAPCLFDGKQTVRFYIEQLYTFLVNLMVEQKLYHYAEQFEEAGDASRAREYYQIFPKMMDLFHQMVVLMGEETLPLEQFREIIKAGFEELQVGLIPAKADQILVGDMERTRLSQVKVLFVVGVNDTNIPGNNTKGGMISDMDREYLTNLGITLAPTTRQLQFRQRFYLYQQLTKPSQKLYLSYALVNNSEKEMKKSYFIYTVQKLFPNLLIQTVDSDKLPEHISELFQQGANILRKYAEGTLKNENDIQTLYMMFRVLQKYDKTELVEQMIEQAFLKGGNEMLDAELARELYGSVLYGSISRLEQYAACPYSHFLQYGLGLTKPQEYVLESADLGNIFHDVLAGFGKDLEQDGYTWQTFEDSYGEEKISERLAVLKEQYGDELLLDQARNGYALTRAERILKRSLKVLKTHMQAGEFRNYGVEINFDVSCTWNASEELMMRLQGRIDRLDVAMVEDDVYVKVIDYKSGDKKLELDCMYAGLQMQLIVYLDSAAKMLETRYPRKKVHPAAMFYYRVADPVVSMEEDNLKNLTNELLKEHCSRGILNSDKTVVHLLDHEIQKDSYIIPLSLKNDGTPKKGSSVCTEEQFTLMRQFMEHKLYKMGSEVVSGHIEKRPYVRSAQETGCQYCPYKGVCGFDEKRTGYEKRQIESMDSEKVFQKMQEELLENTDKTEGDVCQ